MSTSVGPPGGRGPAWDGPALGPLPASIPVTGLVLAGGRGSRLGGVDKGLQDFGGIPLARRALQRLAPQVGRLAVNANRHLADYEVLGVPVWPDDPPDFAGPLAGFLAGLSRCTTPLLATVPCDAPLFPVDLVQRLAAGLQAADADVAIALTPGGRRQPVFCLMRGSLRPALAAFVAGGGRKVECWVESQRYAEVLFDDESAFANANTADELQRLRERHA